MKRICDWSKEECDTANCFMECAIAANSKQEVFCQGKYCKTIGACAHLGKCLYGSLSKKSKYNDLLKTNSYEEIMNILLVDQLPAESQPNRKLFKRYEDKQLALRVRLQNKTGIDDTKLDLIMFVLNEQIEIAFNRGVYAKDFIRHFIDKRRKFPEAKSMNFIMRYFGYKP